MIYIDSKAVDFSRKEDTYQFKGVVREYHATISELKNRHGKTIMYNTKAPTKDELTGNLRPHKPYSFPNKAIVNFNGDGEKVWVYSKSGASIKDGVVQPTEISFLVTNGTLNIDLESDPDFAYFLTKHNDVQRGTLKLYDADKINDDIAERRMKEAEFNRLVYDPVSPLFSDRNKLMLIAKRWGVSGV